MGTIGSFMNVESDRVPMTETVRPQELRGLSIAAKRFESGTLTLVPEQGEELTVICDCGRCHWLATTQEVEGAFVLTLVCHNCKRRVNLPYTGPIP
jgi:hypothetical protein